MHLPKRNLFKLLQRVNLERNVLNWNVLNTLNEGITFANHHFIRMGVYIFKTNPVCIIFLNSRANDTPFLSFLELLGCKFQIIIYLYIQCNKCIFNILNKINLRNFLRHKTYFNSIFTHTEIFQFFSKLSS